MTDCDHLKFIDFDNSYAQLPEIFYARLRPTSVRSPQLIMFNRVLADELGLDVLGVSDKQLADIFSGNIMLGDADPIAMAYAGHQFGHFVPQLGDGRAILLGEVIDTHHRRRDIQLKGSGLTPFSRSADGRAALGPVIREYIVSEAMHALGIPTTRSLAAVSTGEGVYRETLLPGAILTRVAASHIRIGTFEYFASRGEKASVKLLADYVIDRHYPQAKNAENPYISLITHVMDAQASLVARWMQVGFIHGVMNTDNMSVSGETIDYGPCAFMDAYDPMMVFSSIDRHGRYAFGNQPKIAQWNLARLAETLLFLMGADETKFLAEAEELLASFPARFEQYWLTGMRKKLGLLNEENDDEALASELLNLMHQASADFTLTFRALPNNGDILALLPGAKDWLAQWHARLSRQAISAEESFKLMAETNPAYIPRNHRIEQAIAAGAQEDNFEPMKELISVLSNPYHEEEQFAKYLLPPHPSERVKQTFCGT